MSAPGNKPGLSRLSGPGVAGFTLLELLLVVAIILLVGRSRRRRHEQQDAESLAMIGDDPLVPADDLRG